MQTTERPPTGPTRGGQSPVRGVVLVCVAVVIGFFVLRAMDNTSADVATTGPKSATTTTAAGGAAGTTGTTAAKAQAHPPAQVTVLVANASGVGGRNGSRNHCTCSERLRAWRKVRARRMASPPRDPAS